MEKALIRDIMTTDVVTVKDDMPIFEITQLLMERHFSGVPVVDEDNQLLGLVTEYNLINHQSLLPTFLKQNWEQFVNEAKGLSKLVAKDVMETKPLTLKFTDSYEEGLALFNKHHRINPVPVIDDENKLVGIVSRYDLLRLLKLYGHT